MPGIVFITKPLSIGIERDKGIIHFNATEEQQEALNAKYVTIHVILVRDKRRLQQGYEGQLVLPWSIQVMKDIAEDEEYPIQVMGKNQFENWEVVCEAR